MATTSEFSEIARYILEHQERWDGKGYPRGLSGTEISIQARIIAIADAYDAMTSDRPYRKGLCSSEAIEELRRCSGTQFDPTITQLFIPQRSESSAAIKMVPLPSECRERKVKYPAPWGGKGGEASCFQSLPWGIDTFH